MKKSEHEEIKLSLNNHHDRLNNHIEVINRLVRRVEKLEWIAENPPQFKKGDSIRFEMDGKEYHGIISGETVSQMIIPIAHSQIDREYTIISGYEVLKINQTEVKPAP